MTYLEERRKFIEAGRPLKQKAKKPIAKMSAKRIEKEKAEKEALGWNDSELVRFYKSAMKRMTGQCLWCGAKTETHIYRYAIFSICHLLDKRETMCPSVKCHPVNWIELCPDHHTEFDKMNWGEKEQLGFWNIIQERLIMVYPDLVEDEKRHFPDSILKFIGANNVFQ